MIYTKVEAKRPLCKMSLMRDFNISLNCLFLAEFLLMYDAGMGYDYINDKFVDVSWFNDPGLMRQMWT